MARRGLRTLGTLALDGTKIHADASRHFEHHEAASPPFKFGALAVGLGRAVVSVVRMVQ
jgi:hypothetical protein